MRCGLALCVGRFQPNRPNLRSLLQPRPRANRRVHQRILCAGPLQPPWSPDPRVCREASQELIFARGYNPQARWQRAEGAKARTR